MQAEAILNALKDQEKINQKQKISKTNRLNLIKTGKNSVQNNTIYFSQLVNNVLYASKSIC